MKEITVYDAVRADGTLDRERFSKAVGNGLNRGDLLNGSLKGLENEFSGKEFISIEDTVSISEAGMKKLLEMQADRKEDHAEYIHDPFNSVEYNLTGAVTYIGKLSKIAGNMSKGERGFEDHVTSFAMAYQVLKSGIKEKYAVGAPVQLGADENGEEYIMTEEDEMAMLDEAYKSITTFMSTTAKIIAEGKACRGGLPNNLAGEIQKKVAMAYEKAMSEKNLEVIKERLKNKDNTKKYALDFGLEKNWLDVINSLYD